MPVPMRAYSDAGPLSGRVLPMVIVRLLMPSACERPNAPGMTASVATIATSPRTRMKRFIDDAPVRRLTPDFHNFRRL